MRRFGRVESFPTIRFGIIAVVVGAVVLVGVLLFIHLHRVEHSRESVAELMARADKAISGGFYREAIPYIDRATHEADTRGSWMAIAKRAYEIANTTGNYGTLLRVAKRGTANLPGAQQLWAIEVLAEARSGDSSAAVATAREKLTDPHYESFATEAILRAHPNLRIGGASISKRDRHLIDIITSRKPALFENLAHEVHSRGLLFDAALLYAWKGQLKAAATVLLSVGDAASPKAGMLVNYDAGHYNSALSYYQGIAPAKLTPAFSLLADDIFVLEHHYAQAAAAYEQFIAKHPRAFWTPYVDLAWIASDGKSKKVDMKKALTLLKEAASNFPGQREVILTLATLERERGDMKAAGSLLAAYLKSHPSDLDANLLAMQISGAEQSSARLSSRLWELFYQASGENRARVARFLLSYLLGINDEQGVQLALHQLKGGSSADWAPFYRGINSAIGGDYTAAITQFKRAYGRSPHWQTLYNMGIVELKAGDAKSAVADLNKADSLLTGGRKAPNKSPQRAAIYVALASSYEQMGNLEAAKRDVLYARDMDPASLSASLLLKKLDSAAQK